MPRLGIGLPVYNGENFVGAQIESLLAQTWTDFELTICDNASTDGTEQICRSLAARDSRIRYHSGETNIGGGKNMNLVFETAPDVEFYKWAAHDDVHAPTFLEKCVAALDADPTAVLAFTQAELIDGEGKTIRSRVRELPLSDPDVLVRFKGILPSYDCLDAYAVVRRKALKFGRGPLGLYADADGVLLTRLVLTGRFFEVPEVLFFNRRHAVQAGSQFVGNAREWAAWWDPKNAKRRVFPTWRRHLELWRAVLEAPLTPRDRLRCAHAMANWTRWKRKRLYEDVEYHVKDIMRSAGLG